MKFLDFFSKIIPFIFQTLFFYFSERTTKEQKHQETCTDRFHSCKCKQECVVIMAEFSSTLAQRLVFDIHNVLHELEKMHPPIISNNIMEENKILVKSVK